MTIPNIGQTVTASTTVSASPAPTDTVFTVASIIDFAPGMTVLIDGTDQEDIQNITGNVITLANALPFTPTAGMTVENFSAPVSNDYINLIVDEVNYLGTIAGGPAWQTITADQALVANNGYVLNSTSRLDLDLPATFPIGTQILIESINTGSAFFTPSSGDTVYYGDVILSSPFALVGCKYPSLIFTSIDTGAKWSVKCGYGSGVLWFHFDHGYFVGGYNGSAVVNTMDKLTYSSPEVISNLGATLSVARMFPGGGASQVSNKAYFFGGSTANNRTNGVTDIDGVNMAIDAAINPTAVLAAARSSVYSVSDFIGDKVFILGGSDTGAVGTNNIYKWLNSSESISALSETLTRIAIAGASNGCAYSSPTDGYTSGGVQATANIDSIYRLNYANETGEETRNVIKRIQDGATPPADAATVADIMASSYCDAGYLYSGGSSRALIIGKIPFLSAAEIHLSASLSVARAQCGVTQGSDKAYLGGNSSVVSSISDYNYVNDTSSTISATLVGSRGNLAGVP